MIACNDVEIGRAGERPPSGQHFVQHDAEREDIAARVERLSDACSGDMYAAVPTMTPAARAHVGHRGAASSDGARFVQFRQAEIGQLGVAALRDQNVLGLDVAVQNAGLVRRGESVGDAGQQLDDLAPAARRSSCPIPERAAVDELGDQILTALELARIVHGENVRMIERRSRLRFALEAAARGRVGESSERNLIATGRLSLVSSAR